MQEGAAGSIVQLGLGLDLGDFYAKLSDAEKKIEAFAKESKNNPAIEIKAGLNFTQLDDELKLARKLIASTSAEIKVGTSFYKGGSNFAVSKTALLRDVLRPLQDNIKDDRKYQVKLGAYISGDVDIDTAITSTQKKLDKKQVNIKVKASIDSDIEAALNTASSSASALIAAYDGIAAAAVRASNASKVVAEAARRVPPAVVAQAAAAPTGKADMAATRQTLIGLTKTEGQGGLNPKALREFQQLAASSGIIADAVGTRELRKKLGSEFESVGENAILSLATGLANGTIQIKSAADDVCEALIKALKQGLGIASPSKEGKRLGQWTADGLGQGLIGGIVGWERKMAGAIRQAVGNAVQQGMVRDSAARGALAEYGKEAGSTIATSLSKALKQGLAASVAPALKGGLLGATGGGVTGGLMGGLGAVGAAIKQAAMPSLLTFGSSNFAEKAGMLGHGATSLASGGANDALNTFLQHSVESVLNAALGSGGQGALLGAAGVAGVAGLVGLAKGTSGSLVTQAVETIKNRILGTAAKEAQAQIQLPGSTGGAIAAPVENAGNVAGLLQQTLGNVSKGLLAFVKELTPGKLQEKIFDIAWRIDQAADQFAIVKKDMQVLSMKIKEVQGGFSGNVPQRLLPPQPVAGTGLVRQDNQQLGRVTGRVGFDFGGKSLETTRSVLKSTGRDEWRIVEEANGVWQRIKSDSILARERLRSIAENLEKQSWSNEGQLNNQSKKRGTVQSRMRVWTDRDGMGTFNPFDEAFYRGSRSEKPYRMAANGGATETRNSIPAGPSNSSKVNDTREYSRLTNEVTFKLVNTYVEALRNAIPQVEAASKKLAAAPIQAVQKLATPGGSGLPKDAIKNITAKTSPSYIDSAALSLMSYGIDPMANDHQGKMQQKTRDIVRKKGAYPLIDKIPGVDYDKLQNDGAMGRSTDTTRMVKKALLDFYGINDKGDSVSSSNATANTGAAAKSTSVAEKEARQLANAVTELVNGFSSITGFIKSSSSAVKRIPQNAAQSGAGNQSDSQIDELISSRQTLGGTFSGVVSDGKMGEGIGGKGNSVSKWRRATQEPPGALALRPVPVDFHKSFKDANSLIAETQRRTQDVAKYFDTLKAKSQIQIDQNIRELNLSLNATKKGFVAGEIAVSDMVAAFYGFKREKAGLESQTAEVQNLAQAFRDLGIESNAALASVNNQRNTSLQQIQLNPNLSESEKTRASNARDIQQSSFVNDQVRVAQGASGFGGFRGREIGNKTLTDRQQRSELANAIRQLKEYGDQITKTSYNQETYNDIVKATAVEVQNAERALRVLNNTANDGEKITLAARNAWGTILDDFQNLLPQLLVFAVAYNLILQRVMSTPGAVIQAAASFDRLNTSIDSYLSATRGIGDSSGELDKVRSIALDLGIGYEKAAKSYLNFAAATQGTSLQGKEADISRTLTTAGRNQGLSGEQLDRAATALTQILSKGRVQAEELRGQLAEQLPGAVQVAARAYGVTTKELYRMIEAGQLASDEFVDKFMKQLVDEGADVNQLSGSFSNVAEQLGSTLQMLAASAGEPFLQPLTVALQGLNVVMTAMIPLATPLLALFAAIGSNALKGALGVKSWGDGIGQAIDIAGGGGDSPSVDVLGNPLKSNKASTGGTVKSGLGKARSGFGEIMGAGKGIFTGEASQAISRASAGVKGLTVGLKEAAVAGRALGTSLISALTPALKMFVLIEAISFAIKAFKGEIGSLGDEFRKSKKNIESLNVTQAADSGEKKGLQLGGETFMKGLNPVNQIKGALGEVGNTWTMLDAANISNDSAEMIKAINKNKKVFAKAAEEMLEVDKKLYDERLKSNLDFTDNQKINTLKRIKLLEEEKKKIIDSLPGKITSSRVRTQIAVNESSKQALEKQIEERGSIGKATAIEKMQIADKENLNKLLKQQLDLLTKIDDRKTIAGAQSKLKGYQENVSAADINSTNFVAWQKKAAGLQKAINDNQLLPEEQKLMALEAAQKAITAQLQVQEQIGKIRTGRLENERKLIQSNLDLEKTRTRLAETIANRKLVIANAVDDPTSARAAQAEMRAIQDAGQKKEVAGQYQLIESDSARFKVETALQKEQLAVQKQQLNIDIQMLEIEQLKMKSARESGEVSISLLSTYLKMEDSLRNTIASVKMQQGFQVNVNALIDEQNETQKKITANAVENVRLGDQAYQGTSRTADQKDRIDKVTESITASEQKHLGYIKDISDRLRGRSELYQTEVDLAKQKIQAQQEELQLAQEITNVEIAAIDKLLEFQNGSATGGFFEKMAKYSIVGNQSEQDAYSLAGQRMSLVEKMQKEQNQQKALDMNMKKAEIEAEQEMLMLKTAQLKLDNESAKVTLRAANEKLQLAYLTKGDKQGAALAREIGVSLGDNTSRASSNELDNRYFAQSLEAANLNRQTTFIRDMEANGVAALALSGNLFNMQKAGLEQQITLQDKLNSVDSSMWFAKFIDESTSLGQVLSSASQGITEYRQSISAALADGLMGGDNGEAIVNAGKQFGSKLMTSFIDEMVMKPMEKNFFAGIGKLLGMKEPQSEQMQIASNTANQLAISERTDMKIGTLDSSIISIGGKVDAGVQEIVGAVLKLGMAPSGLATGAASAAGVAQAAMELVGTPLKGALTNRKRDPDAEATGWDIVVPGGTGGKITNPFGSMKVTGTGFQGQGAGSTGRGYGNWVSGEVEVAGKVFEILMGHLQEISVKAGSILGAGGMIGTQGETGRTFGAHVTTHANPMKGASVDDAWGVMEKLTQAWESGGIVPASGGTPVPVRVVNPMPTALGTAPTPAPLALPQTPATQLTSMSYDKGFSLGSGFDWSTMDNSFDYMATAMASTTAGLDLWSTGLTDMGTVTENFKSSANNTNIGLTKFSETIAGVSQVIGGIGMAVSGVGQAKKGGLSNILGGIGSVLVGIGSGISGIMGISKAFKVGGGAAKGVGIPEARANGGPISAHTPYLVGERGPELILPGRGGMVTSSDKLREAMTGVGSSYGGGMSLNMSFQTSKFGGEEYVSKSQLEQAMYETRRASVRDGARQGEVRTLNRIQQDPRTRRRIGI